MVRSEDREIDNAGTLILVLVSAVALREGFVLSADFYWVLAFTAPLLIARFADVAD